MNGLVRTAAISQRVLRTIRGDKRTVALMFFVPSILVGLFSWMFNNPTMFDKVGGRLIGLFPFVVMFLAASITTLKERRSGTLERFLTTRMRRGEFIVGYALAFGVMALVQTAITLSFAIFVCGFDPKDNAWYLYLAAVVNALCGMSLGLLASAFAQTEFQVIQFMPAFIFPQIILGGLFVPVEQMPDALHTLSDWLPLTHSLRAILMITDGNPVADVLHQVLIVAVVCLVCLAVGSLTLRKKTA
ncbi:MAG: hypothetical protein RLZZ603_1489 [Actinomycetota bacterium]|jgi:ABC-2 type transport system permease protein